WLSNLAPKKSFENIKDYDLEKMCGVFLGYSKNRKRMDDNEFFNLKTESGVVKFRYIKEVHGDLEALKFLKLNTKVCFYYSNKTALNYSLVKKILIQN
ncbi:hypothetical protein, partial [Acinetobacter proteolyticus]|uniref:hypothetical protein n=1 Tax=Acinetobacter proteolyticus TaxID=1776741 RepID=UPI001C092D61